MKMQRRTRNLPSTILGGAPSGSTSLLPPLRLYVHSVPRSSFLPVNEEICYNALCTLLLGGQPCSSIFNPTAIIGAPLHCAAGNGLVTRSDAACNLFCFHVVARSLFADVCIFYSKKHKITGGMIANEQQWKQKGAQKEHQAQ